MKEVQITKYIADDGREFDSIEECEKYDKEMVHIGLLPEEQQKIVIIWRLVAARQKAELSSKEVCERLGIKQQTFSTYEHGRLPSAILIYKLCKLYNITIDNLMYGITI